MKGCFITFEGGEGVGKTVQALRFAHWLESLGLMFHLTREPGGTEIGGQIRDVSYSRARLLGKLHVLCHSFSTGQRSSQTKPEEYTQRD